MKRSIFLLTILSMICVGCYPTRIVTESARVGSISSYSTTVSVPRTHAVTTTTRVVAANEDISLYLDLQAVGAAFAQSNTVEEFENLLNNESYMLSNLDLNGDGYIDYLRVLETVEGMNHVFLIQAVLARDVYQDVATLVCEFSSATKAYVQVIGAPYIYGPNYIIEPVFYTTPAIYVHLRIGGYRPWHSPWYWDHFPHHYRHPAPVYLTHYHAYVRTFMMHHHYCHEFHYAPVCHYPAYEHMCRDYMRNDFGRQHPERAFTVRNAGMAPAQNTGRSVVNARDIREQHDAATVTRSNNTVRPAGSTATRTAGSTATSGSTKPATRTAGTTATRSTSTAGNTSARTSGTSVRTSGTSAARTTGTTTGTSAARATGTAAGTSAARSTGAATKATTSSAGRTTAAPAAARSTTQTTVKSRVSESGSAETTTRTISPSGATTTTKRGSTSTTTASPNARTSSSAARSTSSSAPRSSSAPAARTAGSSAARR